MEHRTVVDRPREIGRNAAARREHEPDTGNTAVVIKADVILDIEVMPLAGHNHVVVTVQPQLARLAGLHGHQRRHAGDRSCLAFLAAKGAAHAATNADHVLGTASGRLGDEVLHFVGMLGGAVDGQRVVLTGHGHRDMAFEIELVLPAETEPPLHTIRRIVERLCRISSRQVLGRQDKRFFLDGRRRVEYRFKLFVLDNCQARGLASEVHGFGGDGEYRVPHVLDEFRIENLLVMNERSAIVLARNVVGRAHGHDAIGRKDRFEVEFLDPAVCHCAHADSHVQQAPGLRNVVGIRGRATYVQSRTVVRQRLAGELLLSGHRHTPWIRVHRATHGRSVAAGFVRL